MAAGRIQRLVSLMACRGAAQVSPSPMPSGVRDAEASPHSAQNRLLLRMFFSFLRCRRCLLLLRLLPGMCLGSSLTH
jgi:hypothetical protein